MSRLKLLAAAMLLALPIISACGEDPPLPPPTGAIDGLVSVEGQGIDGISVTLSNGAAATTANGGMFRFDGVEAGAYTVTISNYPDDASFAQTSAAATIATNGETVTVNFPGTWIRTSAIMGTVTVENEGLSGVTVTITGVSDSETLTDTNGQYAFTGLRAGNYTIEISGFDEDDVAFGSVASTATLAVGESKVVPFEGTYLRTSAITGQVSVEGTGLENVTVSLQGRGEDRTATTNSAGQYTFSELRSGDYSVGMTNPDTDLYGFDVTSKNVTIAHGETASVPFDGILLRTAAIMGTVTVEGVGLENVMVSVQGEGATLEGMTNEVGQFSFVDLHAGDYSIGITGFDEDLYGFDVTTATVTVALQETATVPFTGILLRTAGIAGTVTVEGHPIPGVTVTVTGGPKDEEHIRTTNDAGYYMVDELHAGDYAVAISDFDANEYEFEATTQSISVGLRETATVAFQGELLRTAGISGRVSVEGMGLDGIMVTLSGDADMSEMTVDGGQYAFTGLAAGDYTVTISGWDEAAYSFDMTEADLAVAEDASEIQNFEGMHTRTASVSGMLFLDEVNADGMHTEGEPPLAMTAEMMAALAAAGIPGVPLLLQGPGVNDVQYGFAMADGSYAFENLMAGSYRVLINMTDELAAAITHFGFRFSGELTGQVVSVAAAEAATVNFPFRIVMQTIATGAVMGYDTIIGYPVAGVKLVMFPTAEAADAGAPMLGTATTDTAGVAVFHFPRAMDLGPGGHGTDHLVFVKVAGTGHPDLVVSDNAHIEIEYPAISRVHRGTPATAAKLLNARANFQWWIKSDADAKDGNEFLEGWKVVIGADTIATDKDGKGTYSGLVPLGTTPALIAVMADSSQVDSLTMKEKWVQSKPLAYVHNPLRLPILNTAAMNDLGPIYITYTTQRLVVGVYREADDRDGYTDYRSALPRGDHRPHADVAKEMKIELLARDSRDRLRRYRWGEDKNKDGEPDKEGYASPGSNGLVTFTGIPADAELTIRYHVGGSARKQVDYDYDEIETFGDDLVDHGVTVGAFGDMSGGGPEVRMCSASDPSNADAAEDEWCATFGYVWMTGQLSGKVGNQKGHTVDIDPETGHGATGDDAKTAAGGAYGFTGIQDGEYSATASDQGDYTVDGAPTKKGIAVYHDEYADEKGEDKADSAWVGRRAQATASWTTTKGGLGVWGYVANDNDGNNLVRGDEGMAGLEVKLLTNVVFWTTATGGATRAGTIRSSKTAMTTETAANGLYACNGLNNKTKYWVQVVAGSDAAGYRNVASKVPNLAGGSSGLSAQTYPALPEESTYRKPTWNRASGAAGYTSVSYTVGTGSAAQTATLHNFGLVYTDGTVAGRVNNVSGSNANIDVRIMSGLDDDDIWERATSRSGEFTVADLMEGTYTAEVEDAGYGVPCLNAAGNAADDDNVDANGDCNNYAATTLSGTVEGRDDYQSMGTLYVYSSRMGDDDNLTSLTVVQTVGGEADTIGSATSITQDADGSTAVAGAGGGTIAFATASVSVIAKLMDKDAAARAMIGKAACPGNRCTLGFNKTPNTAGAPAKATMITVMVTAENGYDDHAYTFSVSRANPVDNVLERGEILNQAGAQAGGSGGDGQSAGNPWQVTTAGADSTAITLTFNLEEVGTGDDAICGQSVSVKINGGAAQDSIAGADGDACVGEQYRLSAGTSGTVYEITVTSQDGVDKKYYINLTKGSDAPENNVPTVTTAIPAQMVEVDASVDVDAANYFTDADDDPLTYEAESDATAMATVEVNGSVLTVTGVAEGSATITVTADDGNGGTANTSFSVTVSAANNAPTVATAIDDQNVVAGQSIDVNVASNFADADDDALTYTAVSDDTTMAKVEVNGSVLTITGVAYGSADITVTADDSNGGMVSDTLSVMVASANNAPEVATPIADQMVDAGATMDLDVASNFSDADDDALTFTAMSDAMTMATVEVNGSMLTITGVAEGSANVTVTADDGNGGMAADTFMVTVNPMPNVAPEVAMPIADLHIAELATDTIVDVAANFSDGNNDALTYAVTHGATATDTATVAISGSELLFTSVAAGTAEFIVTATDPGDLSATDTFVVSVGNRAPVLDAAIADLHMEESGQTVVMNLANNFSDPDDDDLTYSATSSNASSVTATVASGTSGLTILGVAQGTSIIAVTAADGDGASVVDSFNVTVGNRAPELADSIADQHIPDAGQFIRVDVADNFSDADGDDLVFTATSETTTTATVTVTGSVLRIVGVQAGTDVISSSNITVTATDTAGAGDADNLSATDIFQVIVGNRPPEVADTIANQTVVEGGSITVDVAANFTDPDGDDLTITAASSSTGTASVSVNGTVLTIIGSTAATATITVTATDEDGATVTDEFDVEVTAPGG